MAKKLYPGGFRLTLATARKLAVQEFGTAKGLKQSDWHNSEGFYMMDMGNLEINIHPDMSCSGCIQIDVSMHGAPDISTSSTTGTLYTATISAAAEGTPGSVS